MFTLKYWSIQQLILLIRVLASAPSTITEKAATSLERFTILLYGKTSVLSSINKCRQLFTRKGRQLMVWPPTQAVFNT